MGFSLAYLKRGWLLAAIAGGVVFPAPAQRSAFRGGQPILFSSPMGDGVISNTPSLSPRPPDSLDLQAATEAPMQFNFNRLPPGALLPAVPPMPTPAEAARERDLLDRRRNWALLTPAEILGADAPGKIPGVAERDVFGRPKNLTALERYTERQNQLPLLAKTNALQIDSASSTWLLSGNPEGAADSLYGGRDGLANPAGPLFNPAPNNQILGQPRADSSWSKLFESIPTPAAATTTLMPGPSPAQAEGMERFRQLLNPGSSAAASAAASTAGGIKTSLPQSLLGSGLAQPPPVRIGASFTPLNSGIGKAGELPKLTGAWGLSYTSPPPAATWAPQPAPWLSPSPQPFAVPQRKF
jgi:hypothetical protein